MSGRARELRWSRSGPGSHNFGYPDMDAYHAAHLATFPISGRSFARYLGIRLLLLAAAVAVAGWAIGVVAGILVALAGLLMIVIAFWFQVAEVRLFRERMVIGCLFTEWEWLEWDQVRSVKRGRRCVKVRVAGR